MRARRGATGGGGVRATAVAGGQKATSDCWTILVLTDDVQINEMADVRRRTYLAFVDARVPELRIPDHESPIFGRLLVVDGAKSLVAGVRVPADGQQMDVPVSHPRNLRKANGRKNYK